ncbi:MAG: hypothetical protein H6703_15880 [Myxococcales bacterium]|nr:hypothetical protein [Myxococcales bacterium]MCB9554363.1 hypothetical protein [Myxococcales bacterium]
MSIRSAWSSPAPGLAARALDFHLGELARWLTSAGAEPRLAIVLCAGKGARDRFVEGVAIDRVKVVPAPATPARPLHPTLLAHEGDHFNSTLYVVDGFEAGDPTPVFEALAGRVGLLTRTATWVALVIQSLDALAALYAAAPALADKAMRHVLVVGDAVEAGDDPIPPALAARWLRDGRVAELCFHHLLTPKAPPAALDFDRLVRTGYVEGLVGAAIHPERQRLAVLWAAGPDATTLPFPADQAGPVAALAAARRLPDALRPAERDTLTKTLAEHPRARLAAGLPVDDAPVLAALRHVAAVGQGEASGGPALLTRLRALTADADPSLRAHALQAIAAAAAAFDDLEACEQALGEAALAARAAGLVELLFDLVEKQVQIHAFQDRRGKAREALDLLEALAPGLCSPFYAARLRLARGEFLAPLDAARAGEELRAAERLFTGHGYPEWAELAAESAR